MKVVVRKGVFETNSSSAHAFAFVKKSYEKYSDYENDKRVLKLTENEDKMLVLLAGFELAVKNARNSLVMWLENDVGGVFADDQTAEDFTDEVLSLGDYDKIVDLLKSRSEFDDDFILTQLGEDFVYLYKDPYQALVHECFTENYVGINETINLNFCKEKAIESYARFINKDLDEVINSLESNRYSKEDCYAECLFEESAMEDCGCGVDDFVRDWSSCCDFTDLDNVTKNVEALVSDLMNDNLSIFQTEAYGFCYCDIKAMVEKKLPY